MQPSHGAYRNSSEGSPGSIIDVVITHSIDSKGKSLKYRKDTSTFENAVTNGAEKRMTNLYNNINNIAAFKVRIFSIDTNGGMAK